MDPGRPVADTVAIADGRVVSVGTLESLQPWLRRYPHDIDDTFANDILLPGFIDPHTHLRLSGTFMGLNYVGPIPSTDPRGRPVPMLPDRDAVLARLKALVAGRNESPGSGAPAPILAWGYDPGMQGGHLDRDMLDAISKDVPIWVMCYAPHIIYTNTPMLARTGVTEDSGDLPMRMFLVPFEPTLRKRFGDDFLDFYRTMADKATERLAVHGVKYVNDGSYPSMTLRLNFPGYLDGETGLTGEVPWQSMVDRMLPFWKNGIQIHSHANGDETVDMTLNTLNALQNAAPRFDHRFTIEHYCISTPAQARRLAALGGLASVNPYFVHYRSQIHADHGFGPDRAEATARLGSLVRAGATFALHSDYNLVVAPMHPLTAAWIAVNRVAADGVTVMAPGERISVEQALRAVTIDAAFVLRRDHCLGSIEAGKHADFAILEEDPFEVDPMHLRDIRIKGTILAGEFHAAQR